MGNLESFGLYPLVRVLVFTLAGKGSLEESPVSLLNPRVLRPGPRYAIEKTYLRAKGLGGGQFICGWTLWYKLITSSSHKEETPLTPLLIN